MDAPIISQEVTLGSQTIVVRQLTVAEALNLLKTPDQDPAHEDHIVWSLQDQGKPCATLSLIRMLTGLSTEECLALPTGHLRTVARAVCEVNSDFFTMVGRLNKNSPPSSETGATATCSTPSSS
ncbi:MAG: hypothetical protein HQL66_00725 [Magnetococcales bacterium]|nr:hypothetical protein [Magnetococcales bacterium]